tara:strand:+ start:298 stop:702 length:405 start_codon:yes stop_codon:yes gene_type:complete
MFKSLILATGKLKVFLHYISSFKTLIVFLTLSFLGSSVIPRLSVRLNPNASLPSINVSFNWPKASPYTLERKVTSVLDGGFSVLKGLSNLKFKSLKESGSITLEFDKHTDIDVVLFEVSTIIRQLYKKLPEKVS